MKSVFDRLAEITKPVTHKELTMLTETIRYKDVFQLAQEKGYRISFAGDISDTELLNTGDYLWGDEEEAKLSHSYLHLLKISFVELCLLQKWLRDINKIKLTIESANNTDLFKYRILNSQKNTFLSYSYEQTLLHGINEALQLIY